MRIETSVDTGIVTARDGADSGLLPNALVACTVNVYVCPPSNPVIVGNPQLGQLPVTMARGTVTVAAATPGAALSNALTVKLVTLGSWANPQVTMTEVPSRVAPGLPVARGGANEASLLSVENWLHPARSQDSTSN